MRPQPAIVRSVSRVRVHPKAVFSSRKITVLGELHCVVQYMCIALLISWFVCSTVFKLLCSYFSYQ